MTARYAIKVKMTPSGRHADEWLWVTDAAGNRYETEVRAEAEGRAKTWRLDGKPENVRVEEV